jgi:hypothetical protein
MDPSGVASFKDYQQFITERTATLEPRHGLRFAVWCLRRYREAFGATDDFWDGLTSGDRAGLETIIAELEQAAVHGGISLERTRELERTLEALGPAEGAEYEDDYVELDPHAVAVLEMVSAALAWSRSHDPAELNAISEAWINALDFEQTDDDYSLETMFTFLDLRRELERQTAFLTATR